MTDLLMQLGVVDYVLLGFIGIGFLIGFITGMSKQINKAIATVGGVAAALILLESVSSFITFDTFLRQEVVDITLMVVISVGVTILIRIVLDIIAKLVVIQFAYIIERLVGAILGIFRSIVLFCFYSYLLLLWSPGLETAYREQAVFGNSVVDAGTLAIEKTAAFSDYVMVNYVGGGSEVKEEETVTS